MNTTTKRTKYPATLLADFYKLSHRQQYPANTEKVYSTFTPRSNQYLPQAKEVVVFGIQGFAKTFLVDYFNEHFFNRPKEDVINEYTRMVKFALGIPNPDASHLEQLHDLGYLPIELKALKEGTLAPIKTPVLTLESTHKDFFWLTNYLETLMSTQIWQPMTSATISHEYRKVLDQYALATTGNTDGVDFQAHDFSMRGMSSLESAKVSGAGHLLSFTGTDTIPAILYLEENYGADIEKELVAGSIPATEHATMSANTSADVRDEFDMFKRLITEVYPNGLFSVVSDTYDFWKVIGEVLPRLKNEIMSRDGKVVIRPDSGDPVEILCGKNIREFDNVEDAVDQLLDECSDTAQELCGDGRTGDTDYSYLFKVGAEYKKVSFEVDYDRHDKRFYYVYEINNKGVVDWIPEIADLGLIEALWNIFGGTVSKQGYKVLDSHIGAIYGDSITIERATEICRQLEAKGFASTNIVFGIGSYTFQYNTRDSLGFAMKATYAVVDGEERLLFKDPKTDDGTKKSQRGMVAVVKDPYIIDAPIRFIDGLNQAQKDNLKEQDLLETVFKDGEMIREQSLSEIRQLLKNG